jgi:large conductance mechanosensitive channel
MFHEFKDFIVKGNALDLAVGVIIGGIFGAVVASLVGDILMPPIGMILGGADFSNLFATLKDGATPGPYPSLAAAKEAGAVTLNYGAFINTLVNLVIVGFVIFMLVKAVNAARRTPPPPPAPPPPTPEDIVLLREIRDALRK